MKKYYIIIALLFFINSKKIIAFDGIKIKIPETTINKFLALASTADLFSVGNLDENWDGTSKSYIQLCNEKWDIKQDIFTASVAGGVYIDIQCGNKFSITSDDTDKFGKPLLMTGIARFDISLPWPLSQSTVALIWGYGHINGYFSFSDNKLILNPNDVNVKFITHVGDLFNCGSNFAGPIAYTNYLPPFEFNVGSSILPDALRSYFKEETLSITTNNTKVIISCETMPFKATTLDQGYDASAIYSVILDGTTNIPSYTTSIIEAGYEILINNSFTVQQGAELLIDIVSYEFGTETTNW